MIQNKPQSPACAQSQGESCSSDRSSLSWALQTPWSVTVVSSRDQTAASSLLPEPPRARDLPLDLHYHLLSSLNTDKMFVFFCNVIFIYFFFIKSHCAQHLLVRLKEKPTLCKAWQKCKGSIFPVIDKIKPPCD